MADEIKRAQTVLKRSSKRIDHEEWLQAHANLAGIYQRQAHQVLGPHPAADIALDHYEKMLEVLTESLGASSYASVQSKMSQLYQKRVGGSRAENLAKALESSKIALRVLEPLGETKLIVQEHLSIGVVYFYPELVGEGNTTNRDTGLRHYLAALQLLSKNVEPQMWGEVHSHIGGAYSDRISGSKRTNYKSAAKHLNNALEVFTKEEFPNQYAETHSSLASLHKDWPVVTISTSPAQIAVQSALLEKCILHAEHALEVFTETNRPVDWRKMKELIITAYERGMIGDKSERKEKVAKHKDELVDGLDMLGIDALNFRTREERANRHLYIAQSFEQREGSEVDNVEKSIKHYALAKEVFATFSPGDLGRMDAKLGSIFLYDRKIGTVVANETIGIGHLRKALSVFSETEFPGNWSGVHCDLGVAYQMRTQGDPKNNRSIAVEHFSAVVQSSVVEQEFARTWAHALAELGRCYYEGVEGISAKDGIEKSIEYFTRLLILSNGVSERWLYAHKHMSLAFRDRMEGERADNVEKSLEHFVAWKAGCSLDDMMPELVALAEYNTDNLVAEAAVAKVVAKLKVATKKEDPIEWANNRVQLTELCLTKYDEEERREYIEKAIAYCESVIEVFSKEAFPEKWVDVQLQLCVAYMQRVEGLRRENIEKAMKCFNVCKDIRSEVTLPDAFLKRQWARGADARKSCDETAGK